MFKTRRLIGVGLAAVASCAALAGSASAATSGSQVVTGTTLGSLALGVPATPAVLDSGFTPGSTASNTAPAALVVTSTSNWTLTVADSTNNGHLVSTGGPTCTGSEASTAHQLKVQTTGGTSATNSASPVTIAAPVGGVGATAATGNLANALTASYSLLIDPVEQMLAGCVYSTTVNWTVQ
jgi:hypothetical protein